MVAASPSPLLVPIARLEGRVREQFRAILHQSFPPNERESLESIDRRLADNATLHGAFIGEDLVGFALILALDVDGVVLLDYLAVADEHRNRGLGRALLEYLRGLYGAQGEAGGILLEVESDQWGTEEERYLRSRRIAFYRRNGAVSLPLAGHLEMPGTDGTSLIYTKLLWLPLADRPPVGERLRACLLSFLRYCYGLQEGDPRTEAALSLLPD